MTESIKVWKVEHPKGPITITQWDPIGGKENSFTIEVTSGYHDKYSAQDAFYLILRGEIMVHLEDSEEKGQFAPFIYGDYKEDI